MIGSAPTVKREKSLAIALTIAGSDSGGGAGIQADLQAFAALGVHGVSAITCVTAQNPERVTAVLACPPRIVEQQLAAVFEELPPAAAKTGMLHSEAIVRTVARFVQKHRGPLVVDPVMVSTSGARLLKRQAIRAFEQCVMPLASLVTPNLQEAEVLLGEKIGNATELQRAAARFYQRYRVPVLIKGGHLKHARVALDAFCSEDQELTFSAPFVRGVRTHGTGCTYSAAITAFLAKGERLPEAIRKAKIFMTRCIAQSHAIGKHSVLGWRHARGVGRDT